jgi:hypothetical protein
MAVEIWNIGDIPHFNEPNDIGDGTPGTERPTLKTQKEVEPSSTVFLYLSFEFSGQPISGIDRNPKSQTPDPKGLGSSSC